MWMIQRASEGKKKGITDAEMDFAILLQGASIPYLSQQVVCLGCGARYKSIGTSCVHCDMDFTSKYGFAQVDFITQLGRRGLIFEIMGGVHDTEKQEARDTIRTDLLEKQGYVVIPIRNEQVKKLK